MSNNVYGDVMRCVLYSCNDYSNIMQINVIASFTEISFNSEIVIPKIKKKYKTHTHNNFK